MNNKPVYTSLYRCGYMSVFLALTYYSSGFAAIILLLLICHFADAALFFSHRTFGPFSAFYTSGPFFQRPHAWPFLSATSRMALSFSPRTFGPFLSVPNARPFLSVPVHSAPSCRSLTPGPFLTGPPAKMEQNPLLNRRYTCKGINKKVKKTTKAFYFFTFFEAVVSS